MRVALLCVPCSHSQAPASTRCRLFGTLTRTSRGYAGTTCSGNNNTCKYSCTALSTTPTVYGRSVGLVEPISVTAGDLNLTGAHVAFEYFPEWWVVSCSARACSRC